MQTFFFKVDCVLEQEKDLSTVGSRLKQARLDKGLTIKKLAKMADMSEVTLGRWEKDLGKIENHPGIIKTICQVLGVDVDYLFDELKEDSFSNTLRKARYKMGLSRKELALALGVDKGTVQAWESGSKLRKYSESDIIKFINEMKLHRLELLSLQ